MFKKLIAVAVAGLMTLSLAGCGENDAEDFYTMMSSLENVKNASYKGNVSVTRQGTDETMEFRYSGQANEAGDLALNASININIPDLTTNGTLDVLEAAFVDGTAYVNLGKAINSVGALSLDGMDIATIVSMFGLDGIGWVAIESDAAIDEVDVTVPDLGAVEKDVAAAYVPMINTISKTLASVEPAVIGVDNGKYFFCINDDNIEAAIAAFSEAVDSGEFDSLVGDIAGTLDEDERETFISAVDELKYSIGDLKNFELRCEVYKSGKDIVISAYFVDKEGELRLDMGITVTDEGDNLTISAPASYSTLEEVVESVMSGIFGGYDFGGYDDFGDYDYYDDPDFPFLDGESA